MNRTLIAIVALPAAALVLAGCVERQMVVRTDPEDALVIVDSSEIGRSPAVMPFTHYGTRRVTLKKEGYQTASYLAQVKAPWYEVFPFDFFSEILVPSRIVDRHEFFYTLDRPKPVTADDLVDRAEALRGQVRKP